jgi:hypothetical protein
MNSYIQHVYRTWLITQNLLHCFTLCHTDVLHTVLQQVYVDGNGCQFPLVHITSAMLIEILGQPKHDREAAAEFAKPGTQYKSYMLHCLSFEL